MQTVQNHKLRSSFLLLLASTIWGFSFVAQSIGKDFLSPFTFNGIRMLLGTIGLLPFIFIREKYNPALRAERNDPLRRKAANHNLLIAGLCCGSCLFIASTLQQVGIIYTTAGKSGFITAFYIVLVPVISLLFGKKNSLLIWLSAALALCGLYLISIRDGFSVNTGDLLTFISSIFYSIHILFVDHFGPKTDGIKLAATQFFVVGMYSAVFVLLFERDQFSAGNVMLAWKALFFAGFLSCGIAHTLQIVGQKGLNPSIASLLMSMEASISVFAGWLVLGEVLTIREFLGCGLMLAAIILADFLPIVSGRARNRHSRKSTPD